MSPCPIYFTILCTGSFLLCVTQALDPWKPHWQESTVTIPPQVSLHASETEGSHN